MRCAAVRGIRGRRLLLRCVRAGAHADGFAGPGHAGRRCRVLPSPLSGMGTSLALVGAYVLAGELGPAESLDAQRIQTALQRYEEVMRPYIDRCQQLPNGIDGYLPS